MARTVTEHMSIPLPPEQVAAQAMHVLRTLPHLASLSGPGPLITASVGVSWASWGERIEVRLARAPGGTAATVTSSSALPTQFIDWGRNRTHVATILAGLTPPPGPGGPADPHRR